MAVIEKKISKDGDVSYKVKIRHKDFEIYKTFRQEGDAKLFAWYKERLIDNIQNFDIPLNQRITLQQIIELKVKAIDSKDERSKKEFLLAFERVFSLLPKEKKFYAQYSPQDWDDLLKNLSSFEVYKGCIKEETKRFMSRSTIRRTLACISSAVSYAMSQGIDLENLPLKLIQKYNLNKRIENEET